MIDSVYPWKRRLRKWVEKGQDVNLNISFVKIIRLDWICADEADAAVD